MLCPCKFGSDPPKFLNILHTRKRHYDADADANPDGIRTKWVGVVAHDPSIYSVWFSSTVNILVASKFLISNKILISCWEQEL